MLEKIALKLKRVDQRSNYGSVNTGPDCRNRKLNEGYRVLFFKFSWVIGAEKDHMMHDQKGRKLY